MNITYVCLLENGDEIRAYSLHDLALVEAHHAVQAILPCIDREDDWS